MSAPDNRRVDIRADLRTVVFVYTPETGATTPPTFMRAWSEDVSATGARLITEEPIKGTRVWLKFIAPGQSVCIIEADIVRAWLVNRSQFRTQEKLNSYGVRFVRLLNQADFMELVLDHVGQLTADVPVTPPKAKALALSR